MSTLEKGIGLHVALDVGKYFTLNRRSNKKAAAQKKKRKQSGSIDDLYTGTRVSKVPEDKDYTVKVG